MDKKKKGTTNVEISQNEAEELLAMEKHRTNNEILSFPIDGGIVCVSLKSPDGREEFHLDINRRRANLTKVTYQNRSQTTLILARLDFGAPHRNPDGTEIGTPHLHLYKEGYGDKWAYELPKDIFRKPDDAIASFEDFLVFCNITKPPQFQFQGTLSF